MHREMNILGFAIPFNGKDHKHYIELLNKYKNHIDYVYIANNPVFKDKMRNISYPILQDTEGQNYYKECELFLENRPKDIPVYLDCSEFYHDTNFDSLDYEVKNFLIPEIEKYHLEGLIVSDYGIASLVRTRYDLNLDIVVYGLNNLRAMYSYEEDLNITDFILPVDTLRNRDYVEYLKKVLKDYDKNTYNAKLQAVVNNTEYYGDTCYNKDVYRQSRITYMRYSQWNRPNDFFRKNWVLPRWLKIYDEIIETYILEGLYSYDTDKLFKTLDCYINKKDDCTLSDILNCPMEEALANLPLNRVKGKLARCMCRECGVICDTCVSELKTIREEYAKERELENHV